MTWVRDDSSPVERWTAVPYRRPSVELEVMAADGGYRWAVRARRSGSTTLVTVAPGPGEPVPVHDGIEAAQLACVHAAAALGLAQ